METLRDLLQPLRPLTAALPAPIQNLGVSIIGDSCYTVLIRELDPTATGCVTYAISKLLGVGIICASAVVKVPQIIKLLKSGSASGVSFVSYALETISFLIALAYNWRMGFPFSTYGETALIAVQNVIIAVLVLRFSGQQSLAAVWVAAVAVGATLLFREEIVPMKAMTALQSGAALLGLASKAPQIWTIWKEGGTGQLSAFAVINYVLGSISRIFTTLQEVDDKLILYGFVAGFVLNAILAGQMAYYWNAPTVAEKKKVTVGGSAGPVTGSSTATPSKGKSPTNRRKG